MGQVIDFEGFGLTGERMTPEEFNELVEEARMTTRVGMTIELALKYAAARRKQNENELV